MKNEVKRKRNGKEVSLISPHKSCWMEDGRTELGRSIPFSPLGPLWAAVPAHILLSYCCSSSQLSMKQKPAQPIWRGQGENPAKPTCSPLNTLLHSNKLIAQILKMLSFQQIGFNNQLEMIKFFKTFFFLQRHSVDYNLPLKESKDAHHMWLNEK